MKKITRGLLLLLPLAASMLADSCYYDNLQELHPEILLSANCDTTVTMSYATHIAPIMSASCGSKNNSCHNASSAGGGFILADYAGVKNCVESGLFISSIIWDGNAAQMPKNSSAQIDACSIAKIRKWVDAGSPNN